MHSLLPHCTDANAGKRNTAASTTRTTTSTATTKQQQFTNCSNSWGGRKTENKTTNVKGSYIQYCCYTNLYVYVCMCVYACLTWLSVEITFDRRRPPQRASACNGIESAGSAKAAGMAAAEAVRCRVCPKKPNALDSCAALRRAATSAETQNGNHNRGEMQWEQKKSKKKNKNKKKRKAKAEAKASQSNGI